MIQFFANMTFPRAVIIFSLLGSAVFAPFVYARTARLEEVHLEGRRVGTRRRRQIHVGALRLKELQRVADKEGLKGENDPELYIREVAAQDNVSIGAVDVSASVTSPMRGVEDRRYKIRPSNKNEPFVRGSIGNFLYKLEEDSRRVKVTSIKLSPLKRLKPGQIGDDVWTFEAEITSRQAVDG